MVVSNVDTMISDSSRILFGKSAERATNAKRHDFQNSVGGGCHKITLGREGSGNERRLSISAGLVTCVASGGEGDNSLDRPMDSGRQRAVSASTRNVANCWTLENRCRFPKV